MTQFDAILAYEQGELDQAAIIDLFQNLINTGLARQLQGCYGRMAKALIEQGYCIPKQNTVQNIRNKRSKLE